MKILSSLTHSESIRRLDGNFAPQVIRFLIIFILLPSTRAVQGHERETLTNYSGSCSLMSNGVIIRLAMMMMS